MKKYFFVYRTESEGLKISTMASGRYEDAVKELTDSGVRFLFLGSCSSAISIFLYKFLGLTIAKCEDELQESLNSAIDWKISSPYLYYDKRRSGFFVSPRMVFNNYNLEFVGYVNDKAIQDLITQIDF